LKIITGGMVFYNGKLENLDILIEKESIIGIGKFTLEGKEIIDATGLIILPGGIDMHVHFNDPGFTNREEFDTGTKAAISSGITTIVDMPCTSIPQIKNKKSLFIKLDSIKNKAFCDYALYGGITGDMVRESNFNDLLELYDEGVVGFKIYGYSSAPYYEHLTYGEMYDLFSFLKNRDILFTIHAEDFSIIDHFMEKVKKDKNLKGGEAWIKARPYLAEPISIWNTSRLIKDTNLRLHIAHISTSEGVRIVKERKEQGVKISCEVTPNHLLLTQDDLISNPKLVKTSPPVRCYENKELLWKYLEDKIIDCVASDHFSGEWKSEKDKDDIFEIASGISGIDTIFPIIFSEGVVKKRISIKRFVEVMSENPAKISNISKNKGGIEVGKDADLVFIDLKRKWNVKGNLFYSKGKYTPFENFEIFGKVIKTILRGEVVFDESRGLLIEGGYGKWIKREY